MIMGVAVGDALGLPAQFYSRKVLDKYPLVKWLKVKKARREPILTIRQ